ncbi:MAG: coproporphyrinogen-III oxidase family protein [Candidatus Woesearchaeota archaeon]
MGINEMRKRVREQLKEEPGIMSFAYPYVGLWQGIDEEVIKEAWKSSPTPKGALYLHIPFCRSRCGYCNYATNFVGGLNAEEKHEIFKPYVDAVEKEIALLKPVVKTEFDSVYIGGGTPTILCEKGLERIVRLATTSWPISPTAEVSIEVYPQKRMLRNKLALLKKLGVNRLSVGVQDFDDAVIAFTGRKYTGQDAYEIVQEAKSLFDTVNIDLICGLPKQNITLWRKTLKTALSLAPQQITVQPFADRHPDIRFNHPKYLHLKPSKHQKREMYDLACQMLKERGYRQTSRHQFVLSEENRYEQEITESAPRLGIGAHSISFVPSGLTYKNITSLDEYKRQIADGKLPVESGYVLNDDDKMRSYLFYALSADCGQLSLNEKLFAQKFNTKIQDAFPNEAKALEQEGLIEVRPDRINLTPTGIYFTSLIQRIFYNPELMKRKEEIYSK